MYGCPLCLDQPMFLSETKLWEHFVIRHPLSPISLPDALSHDPAGEALNLFDNSAVSFRGGNSNFQFDTNEQQVRSAVYHDTGTAFDNVFEWPHVLPPEPGTIIDEWDWNYQLVTDSTSMPELDRSSFGEHAPIVLSPFLDSAPQQSMVGFLEHSNVHLAQGTVPASDREAEVATEPSPQDTSINEQGAKEAVSHRPLGDLSQNFCLECSKSFLRKSALDTHAKQSQHAPYGCSCGGTYSRRDVLERHLNDANPSTLYPCSYCPGDKSFTRQDKLTDHLRGFHKFYIAEDVASSSGKPEGKLRSCPHVECEYHVEATMNENGGNAGNWFATQKDYRAHLREKHDERLFPCHVKGCERVGGRGFFRKRDLSKHQKEHF